ncbi:MAG TPA: AIR synthase-related protein [Candidatus Saccharimonadales bacterium]|nr:AIR synthase-related protein [Candidatus Saccharimonadales bacterium]
MTRKLSYHQSVNYANADPAKILAQKQGKATAKNLPFGFTEVPSTRGESAYVFDMGDMYGALVQEGLGTKNLIASSIYKQTRKSYFAAVAQDTVACIINDLISVGAKPVVLNAYWSANSYDWLTDRKLTKDFITGWRVACDMAGVAWGGGETQSLPGIVTPGAMEFAGSAFGVIKDRARLIRGSNIKAGDAIVLIESSGVHANGISLLREIAAQLPDGYQTKLPSGMSFGEAALAPTHLYARTVDALFAAGIDVHYLSNITGHGWRKLMRADNNLTYHIQQLPPVAEIFDFIAQHANNSEEEMYRNFNMGAGYAVYVPVLQAKRARDIIVDSGLPAWIAGVVETGPKQVIIEPKDIVYGGDTLEVRS